MTLTYRNKQWYMEAPLDPDVQFAAETREHNLMTIRAGGIVTVGGKELSRVAYDPYPVPHSGEGPPVVESNGYVSAAWMGSQPDPGYGTPIYIGVWRNDREPAVYLLHFAGAVMASDARLGIDNHCLPQLFLRESDSRVVYLSGGHNTTLYAGVSASPHAAYAFHRLHPVGPVSKYATNGHTYPAAVLVGDTLHVVSRFLNGDYSLTYWTVDTTTMQTGPVQVLDTAPDGHSYAIWYQQLALDGGTLVIDTNRRWRKKGETDLSEPEPKRYEVAI